MTNQQKELLQQKLDIVNLEIRVLIRVQIRTRGTKGITATQIAIEEDIKDKQVQRQALYNKMFRKEYSWS